MILSLLLCKLFFNFSSKVIDHIVHGALHITAGCTHMSAASEKYGNLAGIVGIICNVLLFAGKLLAGTLCGSVSVTADAVNNLSDASSSLVTLLGFRLAARPTSRLPEPLDSV